jgi:hypothetical protein
MSFGASPITTATSPGAKAAEREVRAQTRVLKLHLGRRTDVAGLEPQRYVPARGERGAELRRTRQDACRTPRQLGGEGRQVDGEDAIGLPRDAEASRDGREQEGVGLAGGRHVVRRPSPAVHVQKAGVERPPPSALRIDERTVDVEQDDHWKSRLAPG